MRRLILSCVSFAMLVGLYAAVPAAQSGHDLFQQALQKERGGGNLEEALELYQAALKAAGGDRMLAARILLRMAGVYDSLGRPEAQATLERLVRDYGDQAEVVASARARLKGRGSNAAPPPAGPSLRELEPLGVGEATMALLSPDGRYFVGGAINLSSPNLVVKAVATGEMRWLDGRYGVRLKLAPGAPFERGAAANEPPPPLPQRVTVGGFVWSPDSRRIAYRKGYPPATPDGDWEYEIRTIGIDGKDATVVRARQAGPEPEPLDWSPDGRHLAVMFWNRADWEGEHELALVSVADAARRELGTFRWDEVRSCGFYFRPRFSPDGRHLAYSTGASDRPCDVHLMATDGSGARPLIQHRTADDHVVDWTPAGNLLFTSDRGGTTDLWLARVRGGRVEGLPSNVRQNVGPLWPGTLTTAGSLHFRTPRPHYGPDATYYLGGPPLDDIYVAEIDPDTGALSEPALVAPSHHGLNHVATWSADGKHLLYSTRDARSNYFSTITILSMETGEERFVRLPPGRHISNGRQWLAADGKTLLASMPSGTGDGQLLHRVDIETGETTALTSRGGAELMLRPGANEIAYFSIPGRRTLVIQDLSTGAERTVFDAGEGQTLASLAFSSDGRQVTFRQTGGGVTRILVAPVSDRIEPREILQSKGAEVALRSEWSPDGRFIYFVERPRPRTDSVRDMELWRAPTAGGTAEKLFATDNWLLWVLSIDPTGHYLAFTKSNWPSADSFKHWMLERFLPASELKPIHTSGGRQ